VKPLVLASLEDDTGERCVDILRLTDTEYGYSECRKDPEDPHGWRRIHGITGGFADEPAARKAASDAVKWLKETRQ
jgi:hypothetical protein